MSSKTADGIWRKVAGSAAACALTLAAMSAYGEGAFSPQSLSAQPFQARTAVLGNADLEKAFWTCDYAATTRGVHGAPVAVCTAVTDELKKAKFSGDFEEMLRWWQENRLAEHAKVATGDR